MIYYEKATVLGESLGLVEIVFGSLATLGPIYADLGNLDLEIIENKFPERENGYSLLLGLNKISSEYTILSMSDHIFSENIFNKIIKSYKKKRDILLATDPMYKKGYYDINDSTKVFILKTEVIKKICKKVESHFNKFSVTDIVLSALDSDLDVGYYDFSDIIWLDIDNFKNYHQLKKLFNISSNICPFGLNPTGSDEKSKYNEKIGFVSEEFTWSNTISNKGLNILTIVGTGNNVKI